MTETARLDWYLVDRGLARSRGQAMELIRSGAVRVDGRPCVKASYPVPAGAQVQVTGRPAWVSRGGIKLQAALSTWAAQGLTASGRCCLDVGTSTGGFTQVLLAHGALHVVALDVGHGQLAPQIAADPRVTDVPGTNIRDVRPGDLGEPFDLVVGDLSFISLTQVLGPVVALLHPRAHAVLLVKPQFEVGRHRVGRAGVVRGRADRVDALEQVTGCAIDLGLGVRGLIASPVHGTHGNAEYLLWLTVDAPGMMKPAHVTARIAEVTAPPGAEDTDTAAMPPDDRS